MQSTLHVILSSDDIWKHCASAGKIEHLLLLHERKDGMEFRMQIIDALMQHGV